MTTCGTVYKIDLPTSVESVVYTFQGNLDGANPAAGLIYSGGVLYGTTLEGGNTYFGSCDTTYNSCGTVFSLTLGGTALAAPWWQAPRAGVPHLQEFGAGGVEPGLVAEADMAALGAFKAGQTSQGGRLAGAGRAEQHGQRTGIGRAAQVDLDQGAGRVLLVEFGGQLGGQTTPPLPGRR